MSKSAHVVDGEASESDGEVEIAKSPNTDLTDNNIKSFVIAGEAQESDDECEIQSSIPDNSLETPFNLPMSTSPPPSPMKIVHDSILHQKLWECNISLRATIEGLLRHTTDISVEKLTRSDKMLLSAQECMRATNANLTLARARLKQLNAELEKANCSSAFPTVKIS